VHAVALVGRWELDPGYGCARLGNASAKQVRRRLRPLDSVEQKRLAVVEAAQPRPMNGILVAITVMNWTFASSGKLAM
jgi:hypothetical protein